MNIHIKIIETKPKKKWGALSVKGEIQINDFKETLYIPIEWWNTKNYLTQWQEGIKRLTDHDTSCFVVAIDNPKLRKFIEWWVLYKVNNKIYVQNQIIVADIYTERIGNKQFTVQSCYDFIPERGEPYDEDGNKISEWVVELI
ncbi:MAG TPA: hypothetical protein VKR58_04740 [Aquella sp.]|jgi:contact-dependent growth inhibition (CDI) system CdiI-like immunity protein|nr:hypothetical protein [Aquella sp.]